MTSKCVILLCLAIFCHLTLGYDNTRYGKVGITKLEAKKEENHVLNRIVKRAIGDTNEVGGSNDNDNNNVGAITTTDTNVVEYAAPDAEVNNNVSMKSMATGAPEGVTASTYTSHTVKAGSTMNDSSNNDLVNNSSDSNATDVITNTNVVETTSNSNTSGAILPSASNETTSQNSQNVNQPGNTNTTVVNENTIDNQNENGNVLVNRTTSNGILLSGTQPSENANDSTTTPRSPDYNTVPLSPTNETTNSQNTPVNNSSELLSSNLENVTSQSNNIPETTPTESIHGTTSALEYNSPVMEKPPTNTTQTVTEVPDINGDKSTESISLTDKDAPESKYNTTLAPVTLTTSIPSFSMNSSVVTESAANASTNTSAVTENVAATSVISRTTTLPSDLIDETTSEIIYQNVTMPSHSVTPQLTTVSETGVTNLSGQNETITDKNDSQTHISNNSTTDKVITDTNLVDDIITTPTIQPDMDYHTASVLIPNITATTKDPGIVTTVKHTLDNETDIDSSPELESKSTESPVQPKDVQNNTLSPTYVSNATDSFESVNNVTTKEPDKNSSVATKPVSLSTDIPKITVVTEKSTPGPVTNATSPTNDGDITSLGPNSKTSPADNGNTSSDKTDPVNNVDKTSPEPTSETSPAVNVNNTSPKPTSRPDEKDNEGEPEPEDEPDSEPEGEEEPKPESELDAFAEPGPDWVLAKEVWQEAWEFHVYFFGVAFALLGLYCLITLIRLWDMEHLISKNYFVILNLLVILVCILRSTYLLLDAYNSLGTFPVGVDYFMYSTAFPCLTALFSLLFYSLLLATRVRIMSKKVQKLWVLLVIVLLHFVLSIATDIVVGFLSNASVLILVCQVFFIVWGLLMFIGYLILFRKLYKGAISHQKTLNGLQHEHKSPVLHGHGYQSKPKHKYTFGLAVKITFISAFFGVAIVGFELYGIFGVYGALNTDSKPKPWPWWTYHVIVRTLELLMCLSVTFVASQPLRYKIKKNSNHTMYHYMLPCSMCCCPSNIEHNETFSSSGSMDCIVSEPDHLSWLKKIKHKKTPSPQAPYPPHTAEKYSDPDATLLVRKVKRVNKPSMLVVEDGFVRIRREDEVLPSNQFELDTYSQSSHSSDTNMAGLENSNTGALNNVVNLNYTGHSSSNSVHANVPGLNFDNYILQGNVGQTGIQLDDVDNDDTDIDIVVTESEHESDGPEMLDGPDSEESNKSADIFRPLSMIDFAASMESELDRAFHSSCVEDIDLISHNSLPASLEGCSSDSNAFNEPMYNQYFENEGMATASFHDSTNYSSDSADSKSSATKLLHSPVRRCKSEDSTNVAPPKCKHFEKNKYFSLSRVDTIAQEDIKYTEL